ncbi:MAG: DNA methyltransferase, partial [Bacteroidota bacterium]
MQTEFKSKLEEIMPAEELQFEPTPSFGRYGRFLEHAIAHPAKANTKLLEFLIKAFTREGDVVLDPMAGSGSTGVVAALHGRNAVQVELEPKFHAWMEKARENVEKHPTLTPKGRIVNILGDARRLSEILSQADVAITSPPYSESLQNKHDWDVE